jgi:hypothetical protein
MALLSKTPRKQALLNIYMSVLTIRMHPRSRAFMRTAKVLQGRLKKTGLRSQLLVIPTPDPGSMTAGG